MPSPFLTRKLTRSQAGRYSNLRVALDECPRLRAEIHRRIAADEIDARDAIQVIASSVGGGVEVACSLAQQQVIAAAADQLVDSVAAKERVVSATAAKQVCRGIALDFVTSVAPEAVLDVRGVFVASPLPAIVGFLAVGDVDRKIIRAIGVDGQIVPQTAVDLIRAVTVDAQRSTPPLR